MWRSGGTAIFFGLASLYLASAFYLRLASYYHEWLGGGGRYFSASYKMVNVTEAITHPPQPIIEHTAL